MRRALFSFIYLMLVLIGLGSPVHAAKRVALVIGNDDYAQVTKLQKAVNDARAMGATLEGIGFAVLRAENVSRRDMNRQLQLFASRLEAGDEALFFFAGHGIEIAGRNYLLPVDIPGAKPGQEDFVKTEAIAVDEVLERIRSQGTRVSVLVLDACRDNPFPKKGTRSLGGTRGLARMPAPEGTFIMYSAGVGQTALDRLSDSDPNPNSVFTRSLIPLLQQPGLSLTQTARSVRRQVQKLATSISHDQRPAYYDEVTGDFFFAGKGTGTPPAVTAPAALSSQLPSPAAQAWQEVKETRDLAVLEAFLKEYPKGLYSALARARLDELKKKKVAVGIHPPRNVERCTTITKQWRQMAKHRGRIAYGANSVLLYGDRWTNGRMQNGAIDGNGIESRQTFDLSGGGNVFMRFTIDGAGKYMAIFPRLIAGVGGSHLSTHNSWAGSLVVRDQTQLFAKVAVSRNGDYIFTVSDRGYEGQPILRHEGRLKVLKARVQMQFADNYAGKKARLAIDEAKVCRP